MPTVIHEYNGWVLTETGVISCACLQGPPDRSIVRCPRCAKWMTSKIYEHMDRVWEFTKTPGTPPLHATGPRYARRR